jgi:prophage tail gpP-like protein
VSQDLFPLELDIKSADPKSTAGPDGNGSYSLKTFDSYYFQRSILTPAAAFRFTAPGVDPKLRQAIRSGDTVTLWAVDKKGDTFQTATGFIDETDTHITPSSVEYVLNGRDVLGQLVDNSAIDASNKIVNITNMTIDKILGTLLQNTRISQGYLLQQTPNGPLLFSTNPGETKINALQRCLEFMNCLVWSDVDGQIIIGKPNFAQPNSGTLSLNATGSSKNNILEARVKRAPNLAIRQQITQLQTLGQVDAGSYTFINQDPDVQKLLLSLVGRSVYDVFSYGQGADAVNQITQVGNQTGNYQTIGAAYTRRQIARENMKVIDVEVLMQGHFNDAGVPYDVDQMYEVQISDDLVSEDMYVYQVEFEMTGQAGITTRLHLCRKGSICADSAIITNGSVVG